MTDKKEEPFEDRLQFIEFRLKTRRRALTLLTHLDKS